MNWLRKAKATPEVIKKQKEKIKVMLDGFKSAVKAYNLQGERFHKAASIILEKGKEADNFNEAEQHLVAMLDYNDELKHLAKKLKSSSDELANMVQEEYK